MTAPSKRESITIRYIVEDKNGNRPYLSFDGGAPVYENNAIDFLKDCDTDIPGRAPHRLVKQTITSTITEEYSV